MAGTSGDQEGPPVTTAEAIRPPRGAFAALTSRSYRIYLAGQSLANMGTWMQSIAQDWLVLDLTHSAAAVGVTMALQFLPMLLLGLHTGLVADRLPKRSILLITQTLNATATGALARHHDRGCRTRGRRVRVRVRERADLRVRRAGPADVRGRGRAAQPAPRRDRPERGGVPGHPADRAGPRQPADRERGHGVGVRGQCRLLYRPDHRPAAAAAVRSHARSPGPPGARSAAVGRAVPARAPGRRRGRSSWSGCSARSASTSRSC